MLGGGTDLHLESGTLKGLVCRIYCEVEHWFSFVVGVGVKKLPGGGIFSRRKPPVLRSLGIHLFMSVFWFILVPEAPFDDRPILGFDRVWFRLYAST
jgi:hypothetical protein